MKALYNEPKLDLQTPEGMEFSLPLAGPVSRLLALWIDLAVVMVAGTMMSGSPSPASITCRRDMGRSMK